MIEHGDSELIEHGDSELIEHDKGDLIEHGDSELIEHSDSELSDSELIEHGDSELIEHDKGDLIEHGDSDLMEYGNSELIEYGGTQWPAYLTYSRHDGCWWPGNTKNQGINSHVIDLIPLEYFHFSARSVKLALTFYIIKQWLWFMV